MYRMVPVEYHANKLPERQLLRVIAHYYAYLPKQGSDEWIEHRKIGCKFDCLVAGRTWVPRLLIKGKLRNVYQMPILQLERAFYNNLLPRSITVGGSDFTALVEGANKLIEEKVHGKSSNFKGNSDTRWGTLFEGVISKLTRWNLHAGSVELGSIPGGRVANGAVYQKFSPDNQMLCHTRSLYRYLKRAIAPGTDAAINSVLEMLKAKAPDSYTCISTEYKCPTKREPNHTVPKSYTWQPQVGLYIMPYVELGLFIDSCFRKCPMSMFNPSNEYCLEYFDKDVGFRDMNTICMGFVGIEKLREEPRVVGFATDASWSYDDKVAGPKLEALISMLRYDQRCLKLDQHQLVIRAIKLASRIQLETNTCRLVHQAVSVLDPQNTELPKIIADLMPDYLAIEGLIDYGNIDANALASLLVETTRRGKGEVYVPNYYDGSYAVTDLGWNPKKEHWIDHSLPSQGIRSADWLVRNLANWARNCRSRGCVPVGFLPWKLLKCHIIPVVPLGERATAAMQTARDRIEAMNEMKLNGTKGSTVSIIAEKITFNFDIEMNMTG